MSNALQVGVLLVAALASAGCLGGSIESAYKDADTRVYNDVTGGEDSTKSVPIPDGTARLAVKARYDVTGGGTFTLKDPSGTVVRNDEIGGVKEASDSEWFTTSNPKAGAWTLLVEVGGVAEYAFGFYY